MAQQFYLPGIHYRVSLDKIFTVDEIDEFIRLYQDKDATEAALHKFFYAKPKFLYLLGAYNKVISELSFESVKGSSQHKRPRPDFFLQHYEKVWDVVELKKPRIRDGNIVVGSSARPRFACELQDAISQVRMYLDELDQSEVQQQLQNRGILICRPRAWIIAGRNDDVPLEEKRFLEEALPHSIQLVTYDDLAELSKQRTLIITKPILLPLSMNLNATHTDERVSSGALPIASVDVINNALLSLSRSELLGLRKYADWRMKSLGRDPRGRVAEDLLQEAVVATLEGRHFWNINLSLSEHLISAMRSITNSWRQSRTNEHSGSEVLPVLGELYADPRPANDLERALIAKERLAEVHQLFASDPAALSILELLSNECTPAEIQAILGMSSQGFRSTVRRIRRTIFDSSISRLQNTSFPQEDRRF